MEFHFSELLKTNNVSIAGSIIWMSGYSQEVTEAKALALLSIPNVSL